MRHSRVRVAPGLPHPYHTIGLIYEQTGQPRKALKLFISGDGVLPEFPSEDVYMDDEMLTAAATAIGGLAAENHDGGILPPITESRRVARHVAFAVARTAIEQGLAHAMPDDTTDDEISARLDEISWSPVYRDLEAHTSA